MADFKHAHASDERAEVLKGWLFLLLVMVALLATVAWLR
jgi:hypothetical protein